MHIPSDIKLLNLRQLLHKSKQKVNKWAKESLRAENQDDFDYYMRNDQTIIDKNSLLYQKYLEEKQRIELLSLKLEASKGGFIDPNMRAVDFTHRKVIKDIREKFQLKKHQLMPINDKRHYESEMKLANIEKLQTEIIIEQEQMA